MELFVLRSVASNVLSAGKGSADAKGVKQLQKDLEAFAAKSGCSMRTKGVGQARDRKVNARTFNRVGIVVPYDKKQDIGYRPLSHTDGKSASDASVFVDWSVFLSA